MPAAARRIEDVVNQILDAGRNLFAGVGREQSREVQREFVLDLLVLGLEALDNRRGLRFVRREVGRAIPRHHRDLILRQQPIAHEAERRIEPLRRILQAAASEIDQEEPAGGRASAADASDGRTLLSGSGVVGVSPSVWK